MKEEIKEILDNLAFTNDNYMWCDKTTLDTKKSHMLLDYITNLQEEINKLTAESTEWESKCYDLQEENENRISESLSYDLAKAKIKELEYKIDKAIEDLKKTKELNDKHILARDNIVVHLDIDHIDYLLNILQGKSDE